MSLKKFLKEIFEEPKIEPYVSSYGFNGDIISANKDDINVERTRREKDPVFCDYVFDRDEHLYEHRKHGDGGFWCKYDRDDDHYDRDH